MGYIYQITNLSTSQIYIGQTRQDLKERWRKHLQKNSNCNYLSNAIQKYGKDNFEFKLIIICFDEDLDKYEKEYIEKYNTIVPNGYNLKEGGNSSKHHEQTKIKISKSLLGRKTGIKPMLGKKHLEETKKKISNKMKGKIPEGFQKMKIKQKETWKPILQMDKSGNIIEKFENSVEAAKKMDSNKGSIHIACKKGYCHKNYYWCYELLESSLLN